MTSLLDKLIGLHATSHNITTLQLCTRAVVVFVWALALLRLAGKRAFGSGSSTGVVLKVIFGAVLSRAVVAASPFVGTLAAGAVMVAFYRLLSYAAYYSPAFGRLIAGEREVLVRNGHVQPDALRATSITEEDIREDLRTSAQIDDLTHTVLVSLERNGQISVVLPRPPAAGPAA